MNAQGIAGGRVFPLFLRLVGGLQWPLAVSAACMVRVHVGCSLQLDWLADARDVPRITPSQLLTCCCG